MQKILFTALVAGCLAGIFAFGVQHWKLTPLILQAETYETAEPAHDDGHAHEHAHDPEAWAPADGIERSAYSLLSYLGVGVGFALMLTGAMALRGQPVNARTGVIWGLAGFAVFSLAPGFGLPPELPTTLAAALELRQAWWIATAAATAFGLYALVFGKSNLLRAAGIAALAAPHIVGAPHGPLGGAVPTELNAQFAAASLAAMALFWVVLGGLTGWLYGKQSSTAT